MKLLIENWRGFLKEIETETETINTSVEPGDWIIRDMTRAGEEYVI